MCNKLASRHVRVGLASPSDVPRCDICENAPAFFYCEIDGSSLCLQCDMIVHVGGKRTHKRYLLLRQRVEFPGDKPINLDESSPHSKVPNDSGKENNQPLPHKVTVENNQQNFHQLSPVPEVNDDGHDEPDTKMIDLNMKPQRVHGQVANNQDL